MSHHRTYRSQRTWTCTTCRGEIRHRPTIHVGLAFCCAGCVAGGPCTCSYDDDQPETEPVLIADRAPALELVAVD